MASNFGEEAREVITFAQDLTRELRHAMTGSEHLLLGIILQGTSLTAKELIAQGMDIENGKKTLLELVGRGDNDNPESTYFTENANLIVSGAGELSAKQGKGKTGPDDIFFAITNNKECLAYQMLIKAKIDLQRFDSIKTEVDEIQNPEFLRTSEPIMSGPVPQKRGKSILQNYGINLTQKAANGEIDPVLDRENEVERLIQILARRTKNNPVLVGEPGVGKTAIVEGFANKIIEQEVPENLLNKELWSIDLGQLVAGTMYRGQFEERIKLLISEIKDRKNVILFIDEIHTLVGSGGAEGSMDAANLLKPDLARSGFQLIGATTNEEFRKYFEKDSALERRFQSVDVREPSIDQTVRILKGLKPIYEAFHEVKIQDEALVMAANLSSRYIQDRFLPDKAIDLVDEACARIKTKYLTLTPEEVLVKDQLKDKEKELNSVLRINDTDKGEKIREEMNKLELQLQAIKEKVKESRTEKDITVTEDSVADVLSMMTGIPVPRISDDETQRLNNMEKELHKRVVGQEEAISTLSRTLKRSRVGLSDPKRPNGSFIFAGPTGVGKTELSKTLAEFLFATEDALIRIDMSEFREYHSISRLIGTTAGFVGYEEGGQLTNQVRKHPYSVVLFDEIEKAHPEIFNTLLQVLDDGRLTDGQGRVVDFKNTIIIMTTNIGSQEITKTEQTGFSSKSNQGTNFANIKSLVNQKLKDHFRPEFLNRIDDIIVFSQLSKEEVRSITNIMVENLNKRLKDRDITIEFSDNAKELLAEKGFDRQLGARPLRRILQREIEDEVANKILNKEFKEKDNIKVDVKDDVFTIS